VSDHLNQKKPCLRPLEAFRIPEGNGTTVGLRDRCGLSEVILSMSEPALRILSLMDGRRTCEEIRRAFLAEFGQPVSTDMLGSMLDALEQAHFLEGPPFESFYQSRLEAYRRAGVRPMRDAQALGIVDGSGDLFQGMLAQVDRPDRAPLPGPVVGLVAPHLDYKRGAPCYAEAYATLQDRAVPDCVVILGTNHFGRSRSVVSTASDFETPLGVTKSDTDLIDRLEAHCGSLRNYELDHAGEHSIELQVAWLQYLFGTDKFKVAAFLCPDPCGPTGTMPFDGHGVDLRDFGEALRELVDSDPRDILIVAGADLSHVGQAFGDEESIDDVMLEETRRRDVAALDKLIANDPKAFRCGVAEENNPTRICSAGCMFTLMTALPTASGQILLYHQAADHATQTCVTCAAVAFC
jgi:hypothetical protein